jgi:integrase
MDFQTYLQDGFIARAVEGIGHTTGSKAIMETLHLCRRGLAYAHEHGAIARNPWARLRIARYQEPSIKTLTTNRELAALQETAATIGGRTGMLLQLAWATGARRGELLALRWIDVDLTARQLAIGASLYEENGVCTRRPTKTRNSERSITLPATMVGELKAWRATQLEHAMANGWVAEFDYSPVLGDPLGNYWSPATASQAARRALHSGGLKVSLHSIRHSHGSMLLGKPGINPLAAASRLGHRNVKMLLRTYGHVMEGDDAAAAAAIDTVMAGKR